MAQHSSPDHKSDTMFMLCTTIRDNKTGDNELNKCQAQKLQKPDILAVGEACKAIFWHASDFEDQKTLIVP